MHFLPLTDPAQDIPSGASNTVTNFRDTAEEITDNSVETESNGANAESSAKRAADTNQHKSGY
jgi:hypothetical protein